MQEIIAQEGRPTHQKIHGESGRDEPVCGEEKEYVEDEPFK